MAVPTQNADDVGILSAIDRSPRSTSTRRDNEPTRLQGLPITGHDQGKDQATTNGEANTKVKMESPIGSSTAGIDPISRQILERTGSTNRIPPLNNGPTSPVSNVHHFDSPQAISRQSTELDTLGRSNSLLSNRGQKEKKKGFLSRILGTKTKEEPRDVQDNASEMMENREAGANAEVFSRPMGFVPKFPSPPRYIRVKAQNRKQRDLDRLFLAQILSEGAPRSRKASQDFDSKIHGILETPVIPPPNSNRTKNNAVWAAEFSRDGQYFAAGGQDKKLKVWRVISSKEDREEDEDEQGNEVKLNAPVFKQELVREYDGHTSAILDLSWSKNNFLLSSSMDKTVRLYHISRPECLCAFKHSDFVTSISFHPRDDRFFLAGSLDSKIRLWSIPDKSVAYWSQVQDMVTAVAFTPDGKTAIAGTLTGLCVLYDTEGLRAHSQIHARSNRGKNSKGSKITGIETIQVAKPNGPPDVKLLITSNDSRVRLYNLRDRSLEVKFRGNENSASQIRASFSDDGKFVICGSEDKRVYIWPTGPIERQDSDKRPVEIFEAHTSIVTTALLLPTKSRILLARSGDPIYDLCNPPPVKLLSRADSMLSSRAPTEISDPLSATMSKNRGSPVPHEDENPQYASRHSHYGGLILVTGDYTGEIKVFRQDCAYQKRRDGSWDSSSLTRKMLGRSGSVTTRTSERSSIYRKSTTFSEHKSPGGKDSIINWRNSILSDKPASAATSTSEIDIHDNHRATTFSKRDRSASPGGFGKRSLAHRFSLRHGPTPLANTARPSIDDSQGLHKSHARVDEQRKSESTIDAVPSSTYQTIANSAGVATRSNVENTIPNIALTEASPEVGDFKHDKGQDDNDLMLMGDQSYMAWDVQNHLVPMAQNQPRTPGAGMLERATSYVSTLSSERGSNVSYEDTQQPGLGINGAGVSDGERSEAEELRCSRCGNETFAMVRHTDHGRSSTGLKCRKCGQLVNE